MCMNQSLGELRPAKGTRFPQRKAEHTTYPVAQDPFWPLWKKQKQNPKGNFPATRGGWVPFKGTWVVCEILLKATVFAPLWRVPISGTRAGWESGLAAILRFQQSPRRLLVPASGAGGRVAFLCMENFPHNKRQPWRWGLIPEIFSATGHSNLEYLQGLLLEHGQSACATKISLHTARVYR